ALGAPYFCLSQRPLRMIAVLYDGDVRVINGDPAAPTTREAVGRNQAKGGQQPLRDPPVILVIVRIATGAVAKTVVRRLDGELRGAVPEDGIVEATAEWAVLHPE